LGNRGNEVSIFAIILLSVALLFFPVQQGYGVSTPSPELNERQLIEFYKLEQIVKAEQVRDENFVLQIKQNPYLDTLTNVIIPFKENNEEQSPYHNNENFQLIKDEQISIAEKKYKEILGGKDISNSFYNESINKKSIHKFKIDNHIGFMNKEMDDFENLILEQISLAEKIRDEMPEFIANTINSNPYLNENIDESLDKTNKNNIPTHWSDTTFIYNELEFNILYGETKDFEMIKAAELEIAQDILNEMLLLSNSEENDAEIILVTNENKEINNYNRNALDFEFSKNEQIVIAEKKLMEILGQKNIYNSQFLPTE
jgi:hypothetical protein